MGFNAHREAGRPFFLLLLALLMLFVISVLSPGGRAEAAPSPPTVQTDAATRDLGFAPNEYILNGQVADTGGEDCDERGFDYRKQGDTAWTSWTETGTFGTGAFSSDNLAGLESGAVYAVVAKAHNSAGWSYGDILTFRIIGVPELTTEGVTGITSSSAVLHGTLVDDGGEACWRRGFYYRRQGESGGTPVQEDGSFTPDVATCDGFEDGDLDPFTTDGDVCWSVSDKDFYTAPYAAVSGSIGDGQISILSLDVGMPGDGTVRFARRVSSEEGRDLLTFFIDDVGQDSWSGEAAWAQEEYPLAKGAHTLEWRYEKDGGTAAGDDMAWVDDVYASSPASYSLTATGLEPGTAYEFRAFAANLSDYGYVDTFTPFTTAYVVPTVRTDPATGVTGDAATLNGYVLNPGGQHYDGRGFDYRKQGETSWQEWTESGDFTSGGAFSGAVSGLDPNADYDFIAKAHNAAGWGYGSTVTLHTLVEPPLVQTDPATDVTHNSATLNATITYTGGQDCNWRMFSYRQVGAPSWLPWGFEEPGPYGTGSYSSPLTGLQPGTTYEFYPTVHNSAGTGSGTPLTFTTLDVPSVSTLEESDVLPDSATLNGEITATGGADCDERGFDYRAQGETEWQSWTETGTFGTGTFSRGLTALSPGSSWEFRAKAHNQVGWDYGDVESLETPPVLPTVVTHPADSIYDTWANLNGEITASGGGICDERGFDYRLEGETEWQSWTEYHPSGYGGNIYSHVITPLESGATYEFRAKAHNQAGWAYGEEMSFTTLYAPVMHTDPATGVDTDSAVLHGEVLETGGVDCDYRGFQLRQLGETEWTGGWSEGPGTFPAGTYSHEITGLTSGTTYEYRACARNWWCGYGYGEILTFHTSLPPQPRTDPAGEVGTTTATLNGCIADSGGENCDQRGFDYRVQGETSWQEWTEAGSFPEGIALQDGFEDGVLLPFRTGWMGEDWVHDDTTAYTGSWSMRSGAIGDDGKSDLYTYAYDCSRISFARKVSSEEGCDFLVLYDNEIEIARWSGELDWEVVSLDLPPGSHEFRFQYEKDVSLSAGSDCAWVDDVTIETPFAHGLDGLLPATTYEFRAKAHNYAGWGYGDTLAFTTQGVPEVETAAATGIGAQYADLNGEIIHQGSAPCDERGFDYRRMGESSWQEWTETGSFGPGTYSYGLSGLDPGAGYSFRAKAHNSSGWGYGETLSFTALNAPIVRSDDASGVTHEAATLNATVLSAGGSSVDEVGFRYREWGETEWQQWTGPGSGAGGCILADGFEDGTWDPFNVWYGDEYWSITGDDAYEGLLSARCGGMSDKGYEETDLMLEVDVPAGGYRISFACKVSTEVDDVLNFYIQGSIYGTWSGEQDWQEVAFDLTEAGHYTFEWKYFKQPLQGHAGEDAIWIDDVTIESTASFDHELTGLDESTAYEFQALATNSNGTGYGDVLTLKTKGPSSSKTDAASDVTTTSAMLNGQILDGGGEDCDQRGFQYRKKGEAAWQEWSEAGSFFALSEDFEDGWIDLDTGGWGDCDPHWYIVDGGYGGSGHCARSGTVGPGGANYMDLIKEIPEPGGRVTFARRVSCQPGDTWLFFGYQGAPWISWDGEVPWGTVSYDQEPGFDNIHWRYQKLWSAQPQGEDAAWVDDIVISALYERELTGLQPNTTYEYRARAHNGMGWSYGQTLTFKTSALAPVASTGSASVEGRTATLAGEVTDIGSAACDERGFDYRKAGGTSWTGWTERGSFGTGTFTRVIDGLEPNATYEFRAKAHNSGGWGYGGIETFTTAAYTFFFAEGYTGAGFQEYLCLGNPVDAPLEVAVTFMFSGEPSIERTYDIGPFSRFTANVNAEVGAGRAVSIMCEADAPFIAERPMYFDYQGMWTGGHDAVGAESTSNNWYFAEGYTGAGFDEWICVLNPGGEPADLTFRFQTQEEGEKTVGGLSVAPHSRGSFKANDLLGGAYQTSLKLESSQPVVAERPMYFSYSGTGGWGWTGGHCVMGACELSTDYFFAEGTTRGGFEEWLTIQNPNPAPITVEAVYLLGSGAPVTREYDIGAAQRYTAYVPNEVGKDQDVSVHLSCGEPFLAERPMYFNYQGMGAWGWTGGHCVIGATAIGTDWFFAEGYTGPGFEEWLCIQNPGGEDASVSITYYPEGGAPIVKDAFTVAANSRYTVPVNVDAGPGLAISTEVASDRPVIVERPMYFDYNGWTGGHDVVGFSP